jgi:hypothetical protein
MREDALSFARFDAKRFQIRKSRITASKAQMLAVANSSVAVSTLRMRQFCTGS